MVFNSIGFHAALILNRLRNERICKEQDDADDEQRRDNERKEESARAQLALVKRRLADLAAFERRARGEKN